MTLGNTLKVHISIHYKELEAGICLPRKLPSGANTAGLETISQVSSGEEELPKLLEEGYPLHGCRLGGTWKRCWREPTCQEAPPGVGAGLETVWSRHCP